MILWYLCDPRNPLCYNIAMAHLGATHEYHTSWEKVRRLFPAGDGLRVLDIGCGDGRFVAHLGERHSVAGIDIASRAISAARARGIDAIVGNIENGLPYQNTTFDVVLALDILEHTHHVDHLLDEMARVMKEEGYCIISVPNHFDVRTRLGVLFGKGIRRWSQMQYEKNAWSYSHIRFFTLADMWKMLEQHGFVIDMVQYNFMSQGLLPTRMIPRFIRSAMVRFLPTLWSGKFVLRGRRMPTASLRTIIFSETPHDF